MPKTKVIIAGAGIAGPVLALFLQAKDYDPMIYERTDHPTVQGLSLALQTNGLRVLSLLPGLLDKVEGGKIEQLIQYSTLPEDSGELSRSDGPAQVQAKYGFGMMGVNRAAFHHTLLQHASEKGIPIVFGHQLVSFGETADSVTVEFANGKKDTASFLVGCDGLHSNTRECLFGRQEPIFTGLVQTGGLSETPTELLTPRTAINMYGDGTHMISYPVNSHQTSWAITTQEAEAKESWRAADEAAQEAFRRGTYSKWPFGAGQMVETGTKIVKYGLYDRPELQSWHKGRVVLLGDAAHPTSPHLGQGANQAFEDIYHLVRFLSRHNPDAAGPSTELLEKIFREYEGLRIERTASLVKQARSQGDVRVVNGIEACKKRNDVLRTQDDMFSEGRYYQIQAYPFEIGQSEI